MSVTDDTYTGTGYPGGIFNSGFAKTWIEERMADAEPAPKGGQPWAKALVKAGDKHCKANQKLRLQTQNALKLQKLNPYRTPSIFDQRAPGPWLKRDKVPTFLVGQFNDEQTGGHFAEALPYLAHNPNVWISLQNGVHADSLGPTTITRWAEFLKIYIANEVPAIPQPRDRPQQRAVRDARRRTGGAPCVQSRFAGMTNLAAVKATFKRDPRVRVLMDNGGGPWGRLDRVAVGARLHRLAAQAGQGDAPVPRQGRCARVEAQRGLGEVHGRPEGAPSPDAAGRRLRAMRGRPSRPTTGRRSPPARGSAGSPPR